MGYEDQSSDNGQEGQKIHSLEPINTEEVNKQIAEHGLGAVMNSLETGDKLPERENDYDGENGDLLIDEAMKLWKNKERLYSRVKCITSETRSISVRPKYQWKNGECCPVEPQELELRAFDEGIDVDENSREGSISVRDFLEKVIERASAEVAERKASLNAIIENSDYVSIHHSANLLKIAMTQLDAYKSMATRSKTGTEADMPVSEHRLRVIAKLTAEDDVSLARASGDAAYDLAYRALNTNNNPIHYTDIINSKVTKESLSEEYYKHKNAI